MVEMLLTKDIGDDATVMVVRHSLLLSLLY